MCSGKLPRAPSREGVGARIRHVTLIYLEKNQESETEMGWHSHFKNLGVCVSGCLLSAWEKVGCGFRAFYHLEDAPPYS